MHTCTHAKRYIPHTVTTKDHSVFHLLPDGQPCQGLEEVLRQYAVVAPNVKLLGPTSFAPAIRQAMRIVEESNNEYHILLIIADGQVRDMVLCASRYAFVL